MRYLSLLEAKISQNRLPAELPKLTQPGFGSFGSDRGEAFHQNGGGLPPDVSAGLERLRLLPRPRIARPDVWTTIVSDAGWLAESGWAGQAIKLGWDAAELFGISSDPDWQSLAVWLDGRRPLLIGERTAFVDKDGWRAIFNRRRSADAIMLWEIDRWLAERSRFDPPPRG